MAHTVLTIESHVLSRQDKNVLPYRERSRSCAAAAVGGQRPAVPKVCSRAQATGAIDLVIHRDTNIATTSSGCPISITVNTVVRCSAFMVSCRGTEYLTQNVFRGYSIIQPLADRLEQSFETGPIEYTVCIIRSINGRPGPTCPNAGRTRPQTHND